jgi:anti-sigma factor RsiW
MNHQDDHWDACPEGELHRMADRIRAVNRRRVANRAAVAGAALLVAVTAIGLASPWLRGMWTTAEEPAPIACERVRHLMPAYVSSSLSPALTERIAHHLERCEACRKLRDELQGKSAKTRKQDAAPTGRHRVLVAAQR